MTVINEITFWQVTLYNENKVKLTWELLCEFFSIWMALTKMTSELTIRAAEEHIWCFAQFGTICTI